MWVPELGLAPTDETGGPTCTTMEFKHGNLTWTPRRVRRSPGRARLHTDGHADHADHADADDNADDHDNAPTDDATTDNDDADTRIRRLAVLTLLSGLLGSLGGGR